MVKMCMVDECERPLIARGMCTLHYQRWRKSGGPAPGGVWAASREEALRLRTERVGECLVWTGSRTAAGYGVITVGGRIYAHRYAWEVANGPILDGMAIDHMCHNPSCVEASHLRLATVKQNQENLRGAQVNSNTGYRGVYRTKNDRFHARVKHHGKIHLLGVHDSAEEAAKVASDKRRELFTHYQG